MNSAWQPVAAELDRARGAGHAIRFWLRDDDAISITAPLERLRDLCASVGLPALLAVIPASADAELGPWIAANPSFTPCQHGYSHTNHAAPGAKACELGGERPRATVLDELAEGRRRLQALFGETLCPVLVPPWNRIDADLVPHLPDLGFTVLSAFGPPSWPQTRLSCLNADLDIIDWRNGRVGRSLEDVSRKLARLVAASRDTGQPIGILTHHLAHDAQAWAVLQETLERLHAHPAASLVAAHAAIHALAPVI